MEKYLNIPYIKKGMVFSDPYYDESVWCQHRDEFTDKNWLMKINSKEEDGILSFTSVIGNTLLSSTIQAYEKGDQVFINHPTFYVPKEVELGMDTASIFCGTKENFDNFAEEAAIGTATDGLFGALFVFYNPKEPDKPDGYVLMGSVDSEIITNEELFDIFKASFNAKEISREDYLNKTNIKSLENQMLLAERQSQEKRNNKDDFNFER